MTTFMYLSGGVAVIDLTSLVVIFMVMNYFFESDQAYTDLVIYRVFRV